MRIHAYDFIHASSLPSSPKRVVSVGDLHGDYDDSVGILRSLGLMGSEGQWIGGSTTLVQTGDVSDRGPKSREIYDLLHRLQDEAPKHGGKVVLLIGNHELMNLQGEFYYATDAENEEYGGLEARKEELSPNGALGKALRERHQTVALVEASPGSGDGVLFVHGGLRPEFVEKLGKKDVDVSHAFNQHASSFLQGDSTSLLETTNPLFGEEGPYWSRYFSLGKDEPAVCRDLKRTLQVFKARRMVVGHTIQEEGKVGSRCNGRLLLGDTNISPFAGSVSHPSAIVWKDLSTAEAYATYPKKSSPGVSLAEIEEPPPLIRLETPPPIGKSKPTRLRQGHRGREEQ